MATTHWQGAPPGHKWGEIMHVMMMMIKEKQNAEITILTDVEILLNGEMARARICLCVEGVWEAFGVCG